MPPAHACSARSRGRRGSPWARRRVRPSLPRESSGSTPTKWDVLWPRSGHCCAPCPANEQPLGIDTGSLWLFLLGLEVLVAALVLAAWSWRRFGRAQAWIVFSAPVLLVGVFLADQLARFLPNLT